MSRANHTPGPWETDDHETHWSIMAECGQHIGDVRLFNPGLNRVPEGDANAQLIAAAPDLLDALDEVWVYRGDLTPDVRDRVRAAISKARGES